MKTFKAFLAVLLCIFTLSACGGTATTTVDADEVISPAKTASEDKEEKEDNSEKTTTTKTTTAGTTEETTTTAPSETTATTTEPEEEKSLGITLHNNTFAYFDNYYYFIHNDGNLYKGTAKKNGATPDERELVAEGVRSVSMFGSANYCYIKDDNSLWVWGSNRNKQLGITMETTDENGFKVEVDEVDVYNAVDFYEDVANVYNFNNVPYILFTDGRLFGCKSYDNFSAKIVDRDVTEVYEYYNIKNGDELTLGDITVKASFITGILFVMPPDGSLRALAKPGEFILNDVVQVWSQISATNTILKIRVLKSDGSLWSKGKNDTGFLGDGTKTDKIGYVKTADNVKQAGEDWYLTNDGKLYEIRSDSAAHVLLRENVEKCIVPEDDGPSDTNLDSTYTVSSDGTFISKDNKKTFTNVKLPSDVVLE
jgi:alpha-tubulin suppressor-like RCC1 family protein